MSCQIYFVSSPADMPKALKTGKESIGLNYIISSDGNLSCAANATISNGSIIGISDNGMTEVPRDTDRLLSNIIYEMSLKKYRSIVFDFENRKNEMYPFVNNISVCLEQKNIKHYFPERFHSAAPSAELIVECAVSGGSFEDFYAHIMKKYSHRRVCFELLSICMDFKMPSFETAGLPLSGTEFSAILRKYHPMIFFSRELIAKYFTYQDDLGSFHFVIFDDRSTMEEKIKFFDEHGSHSLFILFSDWERLK